MASNTSVASGGFFTYINDQETGTSEASGNPVDMKKVVIQTITMFRKSCAITVRICMCYYTIGLGRYHDGSY